MFKKDLFMLDEVLILAPISRAFIVQVCVCVCVAAEARVIL